ncbi:MAG: DUF1667 domain-containing protein [Clostridia bacterium]|nr:DUF1667 domain-containing protein [Clostridia bacterium]
MKKEMICIRCPKGCRMNVEYENEKIIRVTGNGCKKGEAYAFDEIVKPMRIVTSTVRVVGGRLPVVPVKTSIPVRRSIIFPVMQEIYKASVKAPIKEGQVLIKNPADCGADVVATLGMEKTGTKDD